VGTNTDDASEEQLRRCT